MEIQFLQKLKQNPKIGVREIKGVLESEIFEVENKLNISFPKSYKEFLFLAGESCGALQILDTTDLKTISSDWHKEIQKEELESTRTEFDGPFWLFAESNGCEVFHFFYLEDGIDDPVVFSVDYDIYDDNKRIIKTSDKKFSVFIENKIKSAIRIDKQGY